MPVRQALQVLSEVRDERTIVVTNQSATRVWPLLASHPLDFHYNPSTMGGAVPLALGLALARPSMHVVVVSGDGALTMNLGALVSVVASGATNLTVCVLDNGVYEVTGGQTTAASLARVDYAAMAKAIGFASARRFDDPQVWRTEAAASLALPGPRLLSLRTDRASPEDLRTRNEPISVQLERLRAQLNAVSVNK